jgi:2'-5' RNA ligase
MAVAPACAAARRRLAGLDARLRWVRPEGMHLTLKFLGDVEYATVPLILEALRSVAGRTPPMVLHTTEVGAPNPDRARVIWLDVGGETALLDRLRADLEDTICRIGFRREERRFHPHLTLARARKGAVRLPTGLAGAVRSVHFGVDCIVLYSSELRSVGAVYKPLGRARLTGSRESG